MTITEKLKLMDEMEERNRSRTKLLKRTPYRNIQKAMDNGVVTLEQAIYMVWERYRRGTFCLLDAMEAEAMLRRRA